MFPANLQLNRNRFCGLPQVQTHKSSVLRLLQVAHDDSETDSYEGYSDIQMMAALSSSLQISIPSEVVLIQDSTSIAQVAMEKSFASTVLRTVLLPAGNTISDIHFRWCWDTFEVASYIEDMKDVKCPKDILKAVFNACDEAVEQLRDENALLDVRFLNNLSFRSWMRLAVMGVATSKNGCYFFGVSQPESKSFGVLELLSRVAGQCKHFLITWHV